MSLIKLSPYIIDSTLDFTFNNVTATGTLTVSNDLNVSGNLTVLGTQTTVNSTTVNISDINLVLANNATTAAEANGGGITINGAGATMLYNSTSNALVFSHPISANGSLLTSLAGSNVVGAVSSATTASTVTANAQPNITSVGTLSSLTVSGTLTASGSLKAANISDTTGTITIRTKYNDAIGDVGVLGNLVVGTGGTGNVTASYFIGDGSQLTGLPATYANANVESYLPTYTGNISPGNISIPVGNLKVTGGTSGYVLRTDGLGNLSWVAQSSGSGGGASVIDDLTDVTITSPTNNQVLSYDNANSVWVNKTLSTGGGASVTVSSTAPESPSEGDMWLDDESGELNVYFGGAWGSVTEAAPQFVSVVNSFTGDATTTTFELTTTPASEAFTILSIGGIVQPHSTYSISGNVLTTSSAAPLNTPIEITILGGAATAPAQASNAATTGKAIAMAIVFGF